MWALFVATVYFGTFIAVGYAARTLLDRLMRVKGAELGDVQGLAGPNRGKRKVFLLGAWRDES